jgi:hypothetical protein
MFVNRWVFSNGSQVNFLWVGHELSKEEVFSKIKTHVTINFTLSC